MPCYQNKLYIICCGDVKKTGLFHMVFQRLCSQNGSRPSGAHVLSSAVHQPLRQSSRRQRCASRFSHGPDRFLLTFNLFMLSLVWRSTNNRLFCVLGVIALSQELQHLEEGLQHLSLRSVSMTAKGTHHSTNKHAEGMGEKLMRAKVCISLAVAVDERQDEQTRKWSNFHLESFELI